MLATLPNPTARTLIYQPWKRPYTSNQPKKPFFLTDPALHNEPYSPLSEAIDYTPSSSSELVTTSTNLVKKNYSAVKPLAGPLTHELRERLLGKAPLRLVVSREPQFIASAIQPKYWVETLECSHTQIAYPGFYWDEGGHLVNTTPTAKRRRCQPCKAIELGNKKPSVSVRLAARGEKNA